MYTMQKDVMNGYSILLQSVEVTDSVMFLLIEKGACYTGCYFWFVHERGNSNA